MSKTKTYQIECDIVVARDNQDVGTYAQSFAAHVRELNSTARELTAGLVFKDAKATGKVKRATVGNVSYVTVNARGSGPNAGARFLKALEYAWDCTCRAVPDSAGAILTVHVTELSVRAFTAFGKSHKLMDPAREL